MFEPDVQNFNTVIKIVKRSETEVNGAPKFAYDDTPTFTCACEWKGKGGDESVNGDAVTHIDTAEVTMWYRPEIKISDRVLLNADTKLVYEIITPPENIEMRNKFLKFKVERVGGA